MTSCLQLHMQCALKKRGIKYSKISIDVLRKLLNMFSTSRPLLIVCNICMLDALLVAQTQAEKTWKELL